MPPPTTAPQNAKAPALPEVMRDSAYAGQFTQYLTDPVYRTLSMCRVQLLFKMTFFGQIIGRMDLVEAGDWCPTAATDGARLYYNRDYISRLEEDQIIWLLGHEVLHCVLDHLGRRGGRDPKLWNMAVDYIVNWILQDLKCGKPIDGTLYDAAYDDSWSSEALYEHLKKNAVKIIESIDTHLDLGDDDQDGKKKKKNGGGGGSGDGKQQVEITIIGKDGPPKVSEEEMAKIRAGLKSQIIQAAQTLGAGNIPNAVMRLIEELIEPRMDWRTLLDAHIRSSLKDDFSYNRLSRRTFSTGMMLPGQSFLDTVDICISIDTSGSVSDDMVRDFLSEVKGIMQTFKEFRLKLWTFDTDVYGLHEFTGENIDEIDTYKPEGRGGTMFEVNWEWMKREGITPERFILFTDGMPCGTWGTEGYCDTLFIIYGNDNGKRIKGPDWGITAYYEPKEEAA